ncbi:cytochrome b5 [Marasmius fiardii PR-910]|nr:cytochrome b5 [Marasmius fiardii PR-910]
MTSYLRSWLPSFPIASKEEKPEIEITEQAEDDSGSETEREDNYKDEPPAFPSLNSAQRVKSTPTTTSSQRTDTELMPPPSLPSTLSPVRTPGMSPSTSSSLAVYSSSLSVQTTTKPPVKLNGRKKVALAPGHSPLDWAALKSSGADLRGGVTALLRIPPSVLKQHNKRDDAWTAISGKVYNMTPYLPFHPGGEKELMRVAGRDGTKLFLLTHSWVNVDFMLDGCMVGFLVPEPSS